MQFHKKATKLIYMVVVVGAGEEHVLLGELGRQRLRPWQHFCSFSWSLTQVRLSIDMQKYVYLIVSSLLKYISVFIFLVSMGFIYAVLQFMICADFVQNSVSFHRSCLFSSYYPFFWSNSYYHLIANYNYHS